LEELGGKRIYRYGEGNAEKNSTEDDFIDWKQDLWKVVTKFYAESETESDKQQMIARKMTSNFILMDSSQLPLSI